MIIAKILQISCQQEFFLKAIAGTSCLTYLLQILLSIFVENNTMAVVNP
jgi:hypothetical protein